MRNPTVQFGIVGFRSSTKPYVIDVYHEIIEKY